MTMSKGEKAELIIEPEWGYGKKGNIDAKYPLLILEIKIVVLRYKFSEQVLWEMYERLKGELILRSSFC